MDDSSILKLKKQLESAVSDDNLSTVISTLKTLDKSEITYELIKATKIGLSVGKLRKHNNSEIATISNRIVDKWRSLVEQTKARLNSSGEGISDSNPPTPDILRSSTENGFDDDIKESPKPQTPQKRLRQSGGNIETTPPNKVQAIREKEREKPKERRQPAVPTRSQQKSNSKPPTPATSPSVSKNNPDSIRQQMVDKFVEALGPQITAECLDPVQVARDIENALFEKWKSVNKDYHNQRRSLFFNLSNEKNEELRLSVLEGRILPENLVHMSTQELASNELKQKRAETQEYYTKAAQANSNTQDLYTTDMFRCGKCGERKCTYSQLQTRSADEPMTTFITCCNCWNRWKIG